MFRVMIYVQLNVKQVNSGVAIFAMIAQLNAISVQSLEMISVLLVLLGLSWIHQKSVLDLVLWGIT